jgi:ABC-type antimicrobial peptide transport system permease subunit
MVVDAQLAKRLRLPRATSCLAIPGAGLMALAITLCSTGFLALNVARRRPIEALRFE